MRRAVVGQKQDNGVVQLFRRLQVREKLTKLRVGVLEETGERLLQRHREVAGVLGHVVPGLDASVARGQLGAIRDDAHFLLPSKPLVANRVPADIEIASISVDVLLGRLVRRVRRAEREVEEERLAGVDRLMVAEKSDSMVDQVLGQVVALFRTPRRVDQVVVVDEFGIELIGLAREEAVVAIKSPLERPVMERSGLTHRVDRAEVPLANGEGRVVLVG